MKRSLSCIAMLAILVVSSLGLAETSIPLMTVRDQADTAHCWSYATSHLLEARALERSSEKVLINIEKDVKYWLDYERMKFVFKTKGDFYLGDYEGAWQIEYWESFLKHGKLLKGVETVQPSVTYAYPAEVRTGLPFMNEERPPVDATLMSFSQAKEYLLGETDEAKAEAFIVDYLNRYYGKPVMTTEWKGQQISIAETASKVLGTDFDSHNKVESMVLVKPVTDNQFGWAKFLNERYWGYRLDQAKILSWIELSLDQHWPVTFDNVYHAMTIIGYHEVGAETYYAVADSQPATITWYSSGRMLQNLNLVTFSKEAVASVLPPRTRGNFYVTRRGASLDIYDHVNIPPR